MRAADNSALHGTFSCPNLESPGKTRTRWSPSSELCPKLWSCHRAPQPSTETSRFCWRNHLTAGWSSLLSSRRFEADLGASVHNCHSEPNGLHIHRDRSQSPPTLTAVLSGGADAGAAGSNCGRMGEGEVKGKVTELAEWGHRLCTLARSSLSCL